MMWCVPFAIQLRTLGWAKSFTSKYYYKLMNKMADVPIAWKVDLISPHE